jgi:hypothetical protein
MIFNLATNKFFKCKKHEWAIGCGKNYGPYFGNGELIALEPFNEVSNCRSAAKKEAYGIKIDREGRSWLTNLK